MHGLKSGSCRFWQRTDLPPGSNMLRRAAPSCADLLGLQTRRGSNHSTAHVGESNSRSNVFQIPSRIRLRAQPSESSLGRVPQAADGACKKISSPDRVGRRGLSEPREDFSRLLTYVFPWLDSVAISFACPAVGKFSRASSAGGRRPLQKKLASRIVSVAEDCLSPERTFHG